MIKGNITATPQVCSQAEKQVPTAGKHSAQAEYRVNKQLHDLNQLDKSYMQPEKECVFGRSSLRSVRKALEGHDQGGRGGKNIAELLERNVF